jgi:hypothetical protein
MPAFFREAARRLFQAGHNARADKDAVIADLREDRDRWRTQAEKLLLLTDQRKPIIIPPSNMITALSRFTKTMNVSTKVIIVIFLATCLILPISLHFKSQIRDSVHWRYWIQVFTGNWSPDQPRNTSLQIATPAEAPSRQAERTPTEKHVPYISDNEYISGIVGALLVNLSALGFLVKILRDVIKIKRRNLMNVEQAVTFRDALIRDLFDSALEKCLEKKIPLSKELADGVLKSVIEEVGPGVTSKLFGLALTPENLQMLRKKFEQRIEPT